MWADNAKFSLSRSPRDPGEPNKTRERLSPCQLWRFLEFSDCGHAVAISKQLQVPRDGVDPLRLVRPDGAARERRRAVKLRPARVRHRMDREARLPGVLDDLEQLFLALRPQTYLAHRAFQPPGFNFDENAKWRDRRTYKNYS